MSRIYSANYDTAMKVVAFTEILIFFRVTLGAITFQNSLLAPVVFAHFLRQRYYQSAFTRDAIVTSTALAERYVRRPGNPPVVVNVWEKGKLFVQRWAGVVLAPNAPAGRG